VQDVLLIVIDELARAALGIAEAATAREGVVVELVTVGTNHDGHEPEGAMKFVTEPPPEPEPVKVQVVPEHEPAPELKLKVYAPGTVLIEETPPPPEPHGAPASINPFPVPLTFRQSFAVRVPA
jgi:hypothetical protein